MIPAPEAGNPPAKHYNIPRPLRCLSSQLKALKHPACQGIQEMGVFVPQTSATADPTPVSFWFLVLVSALVHQSQDHPEIKVPGRVRTSGHEVIRLRGIRLSSVPSCLDWVCFCPIRIRRRLVYVRRPFHIRENLFY